MTRSQERVEAAERISDPVQDRLQAQGADSVILGCTELGLLLKDGDGAVPLLDTTQLHADAAAALAARASAT